MVDVLSQALSVNDNCLCLQIICVNHRSSSIVVNVVSALHERVRINGAASGQMEPGSGLCGSVIHTYSIRMGLYRSPFVGWTSDFFTPRIPRV